MAVVRRAEEKRRRTMVEAEAVGMTRRSKVEEEVIVVRVTVGVRAAQVEEAAANPVVLTPKAKKVAKVHAAAHQMRTRAAITVKGPNGAVPQTHTGIAVLHQAEEAGMGEEDIIRRLRLGLGMVVRLILMDQLISRGIIVLGIVDDGFIKPTGSTIMEVGIPEGITRGRNNQGGGIRWRNGRWRGVR